jgi:hypothetical protein
MLTLTSFVECLDHTNMVKNWWHAYIPCLVSAHKRSALKKPEGTENEKIASYWGKLLAFCELHLVCCLHSNKCKQQLSRSW